MPHLLSLSHSIWLRNGKHSNLTKAILSMPECGSMFQGFMGIGNIILLEKKIKKWTIWRQTGFLQSKSKADLIKASRKWCDVVSGGRWAVGVQLWCYMQFSNFTGWKILRKLFESQVAGPTNTENKFSISFDSISQWSMVWSTVIEA